MSQYFALGEHTLWNPSHGAARMFLRQVFVFEAELGLPSGIGPMQDDECQIDPVALGTFVATLLQQHVRTNHAVLMALSEGFIATMLVLARRAGIELAWPIDDTPAPGTVADIQVPGAAADSTTGARARLDRLRDTSRTLSTRMAR
ncbi:DUF6086 family protein [Streptomyces sp. NPDC004012]